jgi:hypothetical protein
LAGGVSTQSKTKGPGGEIRLAQANHRYKESRAELPAATATNVQPDALMRFSLRGINVKRKLTFALTVCLLMAGTSFAQVYVPLVGPSVTSIQFKNNGVNYGAAISGGGSINLAPGCTASGTSPNFTIT